MGKDKLTQKGILGQEDMLGQALLILELEPQNESELQVIQNVVRAIDRLGQPWAASNIVGKVVTSSSSMMRGFVSAIYARTTLGSGTGAAL